MVTIMARKERLLELLGKKLSDEELQEELPQIKCGVDGFSENGEMILEVTGDRPDLLSVEGVARALKGRMGIEKDIVETDFKSSGMKMFVEKSVKDVREFVVCAIARNVYVDDERIKEMMQVQEKLHNARKKEEKSRDRPAQSRRAQAAVLLQGGFCGCGFLCASGKNRKDGFERDT